MQPADGRVGLVVAGAGARGGYEAGALSVLLPRMAADGHSPTVLVGTSAGALNVVGLAALIGAGWKGAADGVVGWWSTVRLSQVANVPAGLAQDVIRYVGSVLGLPVELPSLLDTRRQRELLSGLVSFAAVHENIATGPIDAVAVTATSVDTGTTVVFVESKPGVELPDFDARRNIRYVATELTVDHILASTAVPVAFRPVYISTPPSAAGWYVDGGVRLNVPLKPALALGCRRLGVVSTQPDIWPLAAVGTTGRRPDVFRSAALSLDALLSDRMVEDLHTLSRINGLVGDRGGRAGCALIPFLFAGPPPTAAHAIGDLARQVIAAQYSGRRGIRHPDVWLLNRLIGGRASDHGELISYLLFEPPFARSASQLGALHATATLGQSPGGNPWRTSVGDVPAGTAR